MIEGDLMPTAEQVACDASGSASKGVTNAIFDNYSKYNP